MSLPRPSFTVNVDVTNPGQVLACCGLLELAHRLWPGAEGWFEGSQFQVNVSGTSNPLRDLVEKLAHCELWGLSDTERKERDELEEKKRKGEKLSAEEEKRRVELGKRAREGRIQIGAPLGLILDWWNTDDEATPKTWAGQQEPHKIARAAQEALSQHID
ncbi:MAG: type I-U CRISPR-associated protein Cas8c [Dehalococcoidia bacterium]